MPRRGRHCSGKSERLREGAIDLKDPIPAIGWLRAYDRVWLRSNLVAGLTAAAVMVPQAMAYADIAGLPLAVGLYTALVPLVATQPAH